MVRSSFKQDLGRCPQTRDMERTSSRPLGQGNERSIGDVVCHRDADATSKLNAFGKGRQTSSFCSS